MTPRGVDNAAPAEVLGGIAAATARPPSAAPILTDEPGARSGSAAGVTWRAG